MFFIDLRLIYLLLINPIGKTILVLHYVENKISVLFLTGSDGQTSEDGDVSGHFY